MCFAQNKNSGEIINSNCRGFVQMLAVTDNFPTFNYLIIINGLYARSLCHFSIG